MSPILTELQALSSEGGWVLWALVILAFAIAFAFISIWRGVQLEDAPLLASNDWRNLLNKPNQSAATLSNLRSLLTTDTPIYAALDELDQRLFARPSRRIVFAFVLVAAAPLIGLLGTVSGMLATFSGMSGGGATSPIDVISRGVSEALVTTQAGLIIGIPSFIFCSILKSRLDHLRLSFHRVAAKISTATS